MHALKHLNFGHLFANRRLDEIYASVTIRALAMGLISIFTPIFLYHIGFSIQRILLFYVVYHLTHGVLTYPTAWFAARKGFKHAIFVSAPLLILFYTLLYLLESTPQIWWIASIAGGAMSAFFWMGYHLNFATIADKASYGKEISALKIFIAIFQTLGPVIGGIILTLWGFNALFVVVSLIILASTIPLFFSSDIHEPIEFKARDVFKNQSLGDTFAFSAHGIVNGLEIVVWPVYIFIAILGEYSAVGLVATLSFTASLFITYLVGKKADESRKKTLRIGSLAEAIMWIIRIFIKTPIQLFIGDFIYGGATTFIQVPFDACSYDRANKGNIIKYIIFRELIINAARLSAFLVFMAVTNFTTIFVVGALAALLYLFF